MTAHHSGSRRIPPARASEAASLWGGLRSRFLESLTIPEQTRIFDLSARAAQGLYHWAARYPLIRRVRVWPLALSVAAAAPFSSVEALISTARLSLWVFTLDDLFDEERVPENELMRRAERYRAIVQYRRMPAPGDSLAAAICEVRDDLARYPLFTSLGAEWSRALCGTINGMVQEYNWRLSYRRLGASILPSYAEYLAAGLYSIGGPPHIWAAIITGGDGSASRHLEPLRSMEKAASTCIRLANDVQSYAKEVSEGKFNALVLLSRAFEQGGLRAADALEAAHTRVRAEIAAGLGTLRQLQAAACTESGRPEAAVADIARFVCEFYTQHDYHSFLQETAQQEPAQAEPHAALVGPAVIRV